MPDAARPLANPWRQSILHVSVSLALKIHEMIRHGAMLISKGRDIFSVMLPATSQVAPTSVVNVVR